MSLEPLVTFKPAATKPATRPNTRATLRDLNSSREIRIFRRPSLIQRILQLFGARDS